MFLFLLAFLLLYMLISLTLQMVFQKTLLYLLKHLKKFHILFQQTQKTYFGLLLGYHNITSSFGNRISPITKKSSFHSGIDIGAQEGSLIYSASDGMVSFIGFNGANGYSIHISVNEFTFIYGHVSPNYIIKIGDIIVKRSNNSEILVQNMFLKLLSTLIMILLGKSTNGSTTGPHLHFTIKKDGKAVNPLNFY